MTKTKDEEVLSLNYQAKGSFSDHPGYGEGGGGGGWGKAHCHLTYFKWLFPERELAVESSQPLKDDGIVIITLGISTAVNKKQLEAIASSKEQVLILPDVNSAARVELISDEMTTMICKGKYMIQWQL